MHEMSICQALLDQVEGLAAKHQAKGVTSITLRIGPLAGIEPDLLEHAFTLARAGTVADAAVLQIERLPVQVRCKECGAEGEVPPNRLLCPRCESWQCQVISGDEMLLASLELLTEDND